jgi:hypothetical protein
VWASLLLGNESADLKPAMQAAGAGGVHNWDLPPQHSQSLSTSPLTELNSHLAAQLASAQPVRLPPALQPPPPDSLLAALLHVSHRAPTLTTSPCEG